MSEQNKAIARRYMEEVWGKGDYDAERELVASNVVDHNPAPGQPGGFEGHHHALTGIRTAFPDGRLTVEQLVCEGDKVADRWTFTGTHLGESMGMPPTGKKVNFTGVDILRIEKGKVAEIWHQEDMLGMLTQLGVVPAPGQVSKTEKNRTALRRIPLEAFNENKPDVFVEFFAANAADHRPPPSQMGFPPGPEGYKQLVTMMRTAFPDLKYSIEAEVCEGDLVVQHVKARGTHKGGFMGIAPTGKRLEWTETHVVRMQDGKGVEHWGNIDELGILQQLGVVPAPGRATPQETNKALVRNFIEEVMNEGKLEALDELCAPTYTSYSPDYPYKQMGLEETRGMISMFRTAFPDLQGTIESLVAEGDKVIHCSTFGGTHLGELQGIPPTGKYVTITAMAVTRCEDGKIVEDRGLIDMLGLLQQVGAVPAPEARAELERTLIQYAGAWSARDPDKVASFFTDDCVYEDAPTGITCRGKPELKAFAREIFEAFPDFRIEPGAVVVEGNLISTEWTMAGTHRGNLRGLPATGRTFSVKGTSRLEIRDGKIRRNYDYWDQLTFLKQTGVVSQQGQVAA